MLRRLQRENIRTASAFFAGLVLYFIAIGTFAGCPLNVRTPTEDVCGQRANCGLCSSEAVCVWCPGEGEEGSCMGRSTAVCDPALVVSIPERCPGALPPPTDGPSR